MRISQGVGTITTVLEERLRHEPDSVACILVHADHPDEVYSVEALLGRADAFRKRLQDGTAGERKLVCICLYHSLDLLAAFVGTILAGHIPTMIAPPSPRMEVGKYISSFTRMLKHLQPQCVVTDVRALSALQGLDLKNEFACELLYAQQVGPRAGGVDSLKGWYEPSAGEIAFLQHSSGTTGLQKGVALSHEAVLNQLRSYGGTLRLTGADIIVSWLPLYHDMGLIACFLLPLLCGIPFVQISPFEWVMRPSLLFDAIHRHKGTLCFLPNFAYEFLRASVREDQIGQTSLAHIRGFINCAEPVSHRSHTRFRQRFEVLGARADQLWACYAMAENVFAVTQSPVGVQAGVDVVRRGPFTDSHVALPATPDDREADVFEFVSNGRAICGTEVRIIDAKGAPCPERAVGEICIRGDSLFTGYYLREDLTAEAFTSDGWYKTGDLGYVANGELFIAGRKKDLIIVQGRNFYPSDIEAIVSDTKGVIPGRVVAFGLWDEALGTEGIVILAEARDGLADHAGKIKLDIRRRVAEGLDCTLGDVRLVPARWLVKSTAGKIARGDNKAKYLRELVRHA